MRLLRRLFGAPPTEPAVVRFDALGALFIEELRNATPEQRARFQRTIRECGITTDQAVRAFGRMSARGFSANSVVTTGGHKAP